MTPKEITDAMHSLGPVLQQLVGEKRLLATYGWRCKIHHDLHDMPMRMLPSEVAQFFSDSISQGIVFPGSSSIGFVLGDRQLVVNFTSHGHILVFGWDSDLKLQIIQSASFHKWFDETCERSSI